jgi:hypothetical protein
MAYRNANVESYQEPVEKRKYWVKNKDSQTKKKYEIYKQYDRTINKNLSVKYVKEIARRQKKKISLILCYYTRTN